MQGSYCPGATHLHGTPTLDIKSCPECGSDVELFSIDVKAKCDNCGFVVYNDLQTCIQWCRYAEKCFGAEMVNKLRRKVQ